MHLILSLFHLLHGACNHIVEQELYFHFPNHTFFTGGSVVVKNSLEEQIEEEIKEKCSKMGITVG